MRPSKSSRQRGRKGQPRDLIAQALKLLHQAFRSEAIRRGQQLPRKLEIDLSRHDAERPSWHRAADALLVSTIGPDESNIDPLDEGVLWCFQCKTDDCGHSRPKLPRQTFAGYTATGKPQWQGFLDLCLKFRPNGMDALFDPKPSVVVMALTDEQLSEERLPQFAHSEGTSRVLGQVVVGLLNPHLDGSSNHEDKRTLTIQILSIGNENDRRYRLNLIGFTSHEIADAAGKTKGGRSPAERLRRLISKTQARLHAAPQKLATLSGNDVQRRSIFIDKSLKNLKREVSQIFSSQNRRTRHARVRHQSEQRPTRTVWDDSARVPLERVLFDNRHKTFVVIGKRNRAHIFSPDGLHVTSIRLHSGEIERKLKRQRWVQVTFEDYRSLMEKIQTRDASRLVEER